MATPTFGLSNLGNTCGINTWLQTIFASPACVKAIVSAPFAVGTFGRCVQEIVTLWTRSSGSRRLMPTRLVELIYQTSNGLFHTNEQLDIGELWFWALQKMHENSAQPWDIQSESFVDATTQRIAMVAHKFQEGKRSKILDTFQGIQMAVVKCQACGHAPINIEPFTFIQLEIPSVAEQSFVLSDLFSRYFQKETMKEWACDQCKKQEADKVVRFWSLPPVVVIVLKRFMTTPNGTIRKIHTNIDIPLHITFHKGSVLGDAQDHTYELKSMGLHHGTYSGGHYTSVVQHKGVWYHCDDEEVRELQNISDITSKNRTSYVIIYERAVRN
jgi:ubiquitin C-terminal hydrolase